MFEIQNRMPMNNITYDSEKYSFHLGIPDDLRKEYPIVNMALFALTNILQNDHLQKNFSPHFIPIDQYQYDYPKHVPQSIFAQIQQVFTDKNLPRVIFRDDSQLFAVNECSIYGLYNGRLREQDEDIIYVNKEILECSKIADNINQQVKYAALILFTILHELGHWAFFKFSCNLNKKQHTPCGILMEESGDAIEHLLFGFRIQHYGSAHPKFHIDDIIMKTRDMRQYRIVPIEYLHSLFQPKTYKDIFDLSSLRISKEVLLSCLVLDEELMKFQEKRVFDPTDEPQLISKSKSVTIGSNKRVFESCDKLLFRKVQNERSKN